MTDKAILKKYPPTRPGQEFARRWNSILPEIVARENFKLGHLYQLEILCDLYVEYQTLVDVLEISGQTFVTTDGRNGTQIKQRPEVMQLNRVRSEIRNYSRHLGLLLFKDTDSTGVQEDEFA